MMDPTIDALAAGEAAGRPAPPERELEAGLALSLSGGGSRALLFHTGAIWRMGELGLLPALERISGVSGGSIAAGILAKHWPDLGFDADGVSASLEGTFVAEVRHFATKTIDRRVIAEGLLLPGSAAAALARAYARELFAGRTLGDLPDRPRFVFNASNMQSKVNFRFSKPYAGDYRIGRILEPRLRLADAVAASSAFPPFVAPLELDLSRETWTHDEGNDLDHPPYTTKVRLADGGVYDNLGLETTFKRYKTLLVSDGGGMTKVEPRPHRDWPRQTIRVMQLIDSQVRALRSRMLIGAYKSGARDGAYWGIRSDIADFVAPGTLPCPLEVTEALAAVPTRLAAVPARLQERLICWGYAVADAAIRAYHLPDAPPPEGFPYPGGVT